MTERYGDDCIRVKKEHLGNTVDLVIFICSIDELSFYDYAKMYKNKNYFAYDCRLEAIENQIEYTISEWLKGNSRYKDMDIISALERDLEFAIRTGVEIYTRA